MASAQALVAAIPDQWARADRDGLETANNSDDSPADRIQGDHAGQQECKHHQGSAALTVAVSPCDHNSGNSDQKCNGEEHSAGLRESKPVAEPSPIASESRHA